MENSINDPTYLKPGKESTEMFLTLLTIIISNIVAVLVFYGSISKEEAELWLQITSSILVSVTPIFCLYLSNRYMERRSTLKEKQLQNKLIVKRLEY